jgi:hypothetical protein
VSSDKKGAIATVTVTDVGGLVSKSEHGDQLGMASPGLGMDRSYTCDQTSLSYKYLAFQFNFRREDPAPK